MLLFILFFVLGIFRIATWIAVLLIAIFGLYSIYRVMQYPSPDPAIGLKAFIITIGIGFVGLYVGLLASAFIW